MSVRKVGFGVGLVLMLLAGEAAGDIMLSFEPSSQTVATGSWVIVDLKIEGLVDWAAPSLGAFDLDVSFDDSILSFSSLTFGDQLDLSVLGSIKGYSDSGGTVNLWEVSLESDTDLNGLQADSFILATLTFSALAPGTSPLTMSVNALSDASGDSLDPDNIAPGSVTVTPAPAAWALSVFGLGLVGWARRRLS